FGHSVAIDGASMIGGAWQDTIDTNVGQGSAYVFQMTDSDGDSLPDEWERSGVTIDGEFIDLPAMGADPRHQDIFVHVDWMEPDPAHQQVTFEPNARAIGMVTASFGVAPRLNPDGTLGINLHVDYGAGAILNPATGSTWGALSR